MRVAMLVMVGVLPITLLLGARYYAFRQRMDRQAKRSYARMAAIFLLFAVIAAALFLAYRNAFPLPAAWELALAGVTAGLLIGFIKRG